MGYNVTVASSAEREAKIRASREASTATRDFYDFRNQRTELKVIRIPIDLPVYRMENFRTFTDQKEHIIQAHKPEDFFLKGQEVETVQHLQHRILARLAKQGRADSVVPVIDVLRTEKQREELLITSKGVVVNGNRRLAAMRELYAEDPMAYQEFSHVNCMVLPDDATPEEVVDIEAALQAKPETRLDYDWVGDCQLINKLLTMGRTIPEIAQRLNRKPSEVRNALQALSEANTYLKDWASAEGEYTRVRDAAEQFFKDLPGQLEGKDPTLQEASRIIAWTLYDNRAKLGQRLYDFNIAFGKRAADVVERIRDTLDIPAPEQDSFSVDLFDVALDDDQPQNIGPVLEALRDPERREENSDTIIEVCRSIIEVDREEKTGRGPLRAITAAKNKLVGVDLTSAAPETYPAIGKQLQSVAQLTSELQKKLTEYQKASSDAG